MKQRIFCLLLALAGLPTWAAPKPNVLFIAIDDLRPELGCYGSKSIKSPNIDALAKTAVVFERAYCQVAVCNPSRVSIMTGLRPDTTKVWDLITRFRETTPDAVTIPQHFMKHGYYAASFGKVFHNPWPDNQSWSEPHAWPGNSKLWSAEARERLADYREGMKADGKSQAAIRRMRAQATEIVDIPDSEHIDGAIADQALAAMRRLAQKDEPFFLAAGFIRPHLPFVVPRKYWEMYERDEIPLADNRYIPRNSPGFAMNTMYELRDYFDYNHTDDPRHGTLTEAQQRELKHGYYASVSLIDAQVGRLLRELEQLGLADNTIVVLWGDHGWKLGEHNSWCKQSNYEIDTRVPLIIRAPGAKANGEMAGGLAEFVDVYPTLCELAGLPIPGQLEGVSLKPALENAKAPVKDFAISQYKRRQRTRELMGYTLRTDRYRYVEWLDRATATVIARELYDHLMDPQENENIGYEGAEQLLKRLSKKLWATIERPKPTGKVRPRLTIHNHSRQAITVFWDRPGGPPKQVAVVPIGGRHVSNTTIGHRFLIHGNLNGFKTAVTVRQQNQTFNLRAGQGALIPKKQEARQDARPNILVLMADDWSYPHAGILGDPVVKTPTFDRLAREGVLFENAFVSAPSCTPSRHAVASGQYHWRLGDGVNLGGSIAKNVPVYPDLLAATGYTTGFSRKGTAPSQHRFRKNDPFGPRFSSFREFFEGRDRSRPFCFWYGAGEPHRPYDWEASKRADIALDLIKVPGCLPDNKAVRTDLGDYYVKVERFDRDAAAMLRLLAEGGELENTIVVMTGDNGMPFPRCKATLYDMGTRVPLAIRWGSRVRGGRRIEDFINLTDLAPTFLEAVGLEVPKAMTGRSVMPHLTSKMNGVIESERNHVLVGMERHVYPYPSRAIRTKDFLYIRNFAPAEWPTGETGPKPPFFDFAKTPWPTEPGAFAFNVDPSPTKQWMLHHRDECPNLHSLAFGRRPAEELYDLRKDPEQLKNVADEPDYTEVRRGLAKRLAKGLRASGDPRFKQADHATFQIHGWDIHLHDRMWTDKPAKTKEALKLLGPQLERVVNVVPKKALAALRKVPVWINPQYPGIRPTAEYHYEAWWLRANKRNVAMVRSVEMTNVEQFAFENKRMPYVMLHELAHAYHEQVLGFDEPRVKAAYEKAKASGGYDKVKRFNGREIVEDKAYAMSNHKEYFAEATEAYFGKNDFFPFNRKELKKHDPEIFELLGELWGVE